MLWHTQTGNIINSLKVKLDFTLPTLGTTNVITWECHMDDSAKGRYDMILGQDILTELVLNLKFSEHVIKADDGTFKGSTAPMVHLGMYIFKDLNTEKITPKESFKNDCIKELYKLE